jgi:hypothetical protein
MPALAGQGKSETILVGGVIGVQADRHPVSRLRLGVPALKDQG